MPIILDDNRYDETHNDDGSITRLDRELSIVTGTISKLKNQNNQKDNCRIPKIGKDSDQSSQSDNHCKWTFYSP